MKKKILGFIGMGVKEIFWLAVAGGIIFGGISGFKYLKENKETIEASPIERPIALVETTSLVLVTAPLPIRAEGFIKPFRIVNLSAQVGGQITMLSASITNRSDFRRGDILAKLDDLTEKATLIRTKANIAATQARIDLNTRELKRTEALRKKGAVSQQALDQRLGQQAELEATLNSLQATMRLAEVALQKRILIAPFDGAILSKSAEIGTVIGGGQTIATIFTQDKMEIDVPIREADAALIPGLFDGRPATAKVRINFAKKEFEWDAQVTRVASDLDIRTRTLRVTLQLDNVLKAKAVKSDVLASGTPPPFINSFAKVVIKGMTPTSTYLVPSTAVRNGKFIWLSEKGSQGLNVLKIVDIELTHVDGETSYVRAPKINGTQRLIVTNLSTPQEGMRIRDVDTKDYKSSNIDTLKLKVIE